MIFKKSFLFIFICLNLISSENISLQNYIMEFLKDPDDISYKNIVNCLNFNSNDDDIKRFNINAENFQSLINSFKEKNNYIIKFSFLLLLRFDLSEEGKKDLLVKLKPIILNNPLLLDEIPYNYPFPKNDLKKILELLIIDKENIVQTIKTYNIINNKIYEVKDKSIIYSHLYEILKKYYSNIKNLEEYKVFVEKYSKISRTLWNNFCNNPNKENYVKLKNYLEDVKIPDELFYFTMENEDSSLDKFLTLLEKKNNYAIDIGFHLLSTGLFPLGSYFEFLRIDLSSLFEKDSDIFYKYYLKYKDNLGERDVNEIICPLMDTADNYKIILEKINVRIKELKKSNFIDNETKQKWLQVLEKDKENIQELIHDEKLREKIEKENQNKIKFFNR